MPAYRTYVIDHDELVYRLIEHEAPDDAIALATAEAYGEHHSAVEVWERSRLVGRLGMEFSLSA
jgi:hypothetical protein